MPRTNAVLIVVLIVACAPILAAPDPDRVDFDRDVRPILSSKCSLCHGPDSAAREADLRLDTREGAFADLGGYRPVVPGKPKESEVFLRIAAEDEDDRMPPADSKLSLSADEIDIVRRWIAEGAEWRQHWSFVAPEKPSLPAVKTEEWPRNGIDRFVLARLEREGIEPAPKADRATWIRRVSLDLTGLPPTPAEVNEFLADGTPEAHERVVDRLLASPRYGEHLARPWLDAARYADSNGYQYDTERTQWPWRDWVIDAYNANKPFDEFTVEQLAGDLLPNATLEQKIATGFNRNHGITVEGGVIDEEYRTEYVIDRVVTTAAVWTGLTFICARCHDHKYDPIAQKDFYSFFAFFNQVPERGLNGFAPKIRVPARGVEAARAKLQERRASLRAAEPEIAAAQSEWERNITAPGARRPAIWSIAPALEATASSGAELKTLADGSTLAGGKAPGEEVYEVLVESDLEAIAVIRLEALTHESLPHGGPGRAFNSNFVLSEVEVMASPRSAGSKERRVVLVTAEADHSQGGFEIAKAIDGKPGTGWAVDGPSKKEPRVAVFRARKPFGFAGGTRLRVRLRHHYGSAHTIGRFRISLSARPDAGFGQPIEAVATVPAGDRSDEQSRRLRQHFLTSAAPESLRALQAAVSGLEQEVATQEKRGVEVMVMAQLAKPRVTHVLERGQYDKKREVVSAGVPAVLPPLETEATATRLDLARWLVSGKHPLTARVAVNRYWQRFFGLGLVKTSEDFGSQGERPSHPALLDWLAVEFVESGWNVKAMQRRIALSATYRQMSRIRSELAERDPENRLLARGPRGRLPAEVIRDNALAVSGLLVERVGGPSVYPYHPEGLWLEINNRPGYSKAYVQGHGKDLYRRSIYTYWKRTVPPPTLQTFDAPEREFCVLRRSATTTPLQAFVLLHDPQFVEAARHLARRMLEEGGETAEDRARFGFRLLMSRVPDAKETAILLRVLRERESLYREDPDAARKLLNVGESPRDKRLDLVEHAAWTAVARVLLNLSETVTKS